MSVKFMHSFGYITGPDTPAGAVAAPEFTPAPEESQFSLLGNVQPAGYVAGGAVFQSASAATTSEASWRGAIISPTIPPELNLKTWVGARVRIDSLGATADFTSLAVYSVTNRTYRYLTINRTDIASDANVNGRQFMLSVSLMRLPASRVSVEAYVNGSRVTSIILTNEADASELKIVIGFGNNPGCLATDRFTLWDLVTVYDDGVGLTNLTKRWGIKAGRVSKIDYAQYNAWRDAGAAKDRAGFLNDYSTYLTRASKADTLDTEDVGNNTAVYNFEPPPNITKVHAVGAWIKHRSADRRSATTYTVSSKLMSNDVVVRRAAPTTAIPRYQPLLMTGTKDASADRPLDLSDLQNLRLTISVNSVG